MKVGLLSILSCAAAFATVSGCSTSSGQAAIAAGNTEADRVVKGSLWLRANTPKEIKTLRVIESDAKPPTWKTCIKECTVNITQVVYGTTTCTMTIDAEVLLVKGKAKIHWSVTDKDHQFWDGTDVEFPNQSSWTPTENAGAVEIELDFRGTSTMEVHKYNITARKKANKGDGCKVDPLIVNTG